MAFLVVIVRICVRQPRRLEQVGRVDRTVMDRWLMNVIWTADRVPRHRKSAKASFAAFESRPSISRISCPSGWSVPYDSSNCSRLPGPATSSACFHFSPLRPAIIWHSAEKNTHTVTEEARRRFARNGKIFSKNWDGSLCRPSGTTLCITATCSCIPLSGGQET